MKKLVAALAVGVIVSGTAVSSVSAESYDVKEGDSLWNIADQYNTTVDELVEINELKSTTIQPKQEIVIDNEVEKYVVEKGDTLGSISKDHDTTVSKLKDWNDLKSDLIVTGQELSVNGTQVADKEKAPATEKKAEPKQETKKAPKEEVKTEPKKETKAEPKEEPKKEAKEEASNDEGDKSPEGKTISVSATAYTGQCDGCSGVTSTGVDLNANPNAKVIAVDPSVIPLGSKVHVEGYGEATAADVGGAINGNKIDVHVPTKGEANNWGVKTVNVTILD
ncbi:3D (Asp-Asp-Asp) domain-containing protein/LysM repeat protein [Virgibacillus halotolerans]|uniref:3D domain-containing protein n=1 Tax=Virgibacillus halotolerans TaxID=1071053 RepID=UPI0019600222|nr:3D domain-containing protein [Virgibacillus halotolerans]MBM7600754.1 3D (Asp-Asp-Asp) domain-containing protein/LysM repeat protein [Virgibacillus halotolerans]